MLVEICGVGVMAGEDNLWPPLSQFVTKIIIIFGTVCASVRTHVRELGGRGVCERKVCAE